MKEDAAFGLWRKTFHELVDAGFDPGATHRPAITMETVVEDGDVPVRMFALGPTLIRDVPEPTDWEPIEEIARGGMGLIYRANQKRLRREIALKVAIPGVGMATKERFIAEALVTANLAHPNIVPIYDLMTAPGGDVGLAMKLIGGMAWSSLLHPRTGAQHEAASKCDLEFHLETLLSLTNAVAFAHSKDIVHNDLKPENVMVGEFGEVLLMDWGLAVDVSADPADDAFAPHRSTMPMPCGTPSYMPPELAIGEYEQVGPATDVYLLGSILHEIVTGKPPHRGRELRDVLRSVLTSAPPRFDSTVPKALQTICAKAMAKEPTDRFDSVLEFQGAIRDFMRHRESMTISKAASETLTRTERSAADAGVEGRERRIDRYNRFADAVAGFRQALVLWDDNTVARKGVVAARLAFARAALNDGDLGLAESQVSALADQSAEAAGLLRSIRIAKAQRIAAARSATLARRSLVGALLLIVVGLTVGVFVITQQKQQVAASSALAEARLADVLRLADVKRIADLEATAAGLWPATPENAPKMQAWLEQVQPVLQRIDSHKSYLIGLRESGTRGDDGRWTFANAEAQWEHDTLSKLVDDLDRLGAETRPEVQGRLQFARTVKEQTIDAYADAWAQAVARVKASSTYQRVALAPILGLVPIGPDPVTGFEELAHVQSGAVPARGRGGVLEIGEATGVVLVLVPGGAFEMGARAAEKGHPRGSANVDSLARAIEGPVHRVSLDPFLLGKYEFTQGQWTKIGEANPSAYKPGTLHGGRTTTPRHPVEQVRWAEATKALARVELELPTEAQWEYAARARSTTTFWAGDTPRSMAGTMNIADRYCKEHGGPGSWRYETWLDSTFPNPGSPSMKTGLFKRGSFSTSC